MRSYLNGTWYEKTFSEGEKDKILTTNVVNLDNSSYGTERGNDTEDKVFLLSLDEAEHYFSSDDERVAKNYSVAVDWWLRSPGDFTNTAASVEDDGEVKYSGSVFSNRGSCISREDVGVRPALWVNLNS